jgi:uncharacterized membrane protein YfcA
MSFFLALFLYLIIGAIAGIVGGLLGIGGGSLTVPALLLVFSFLPFPKDHIMHIAIGTSLCAMVINTSAATFFHHRKGAVVWEAIRLILLGVVFGSFLGAFLATGLSNDFLKELFGVFACLIGLIFVKPANKIAHDTHKMPGFFAFSLIGIAVATLANLLGIGGGFFMLPLLMYFRFNEKKAIATSSATTLLISLGGAVGYLISADQQVPIPGCFGYVYIPAFVAISISSFVASFYGVKLAHVLPAPLLRKIFATTMIGIGLSMIFA